MDMKRKRVYVEEIDTTLQGYMIDKPYVSAAMFIKSLSDLPIVVCRQITNTYSIRNVFKRIEIGSEEIPLFPLDSFEPLSDVLSEIENRKFRELRKHKKRCEPSDYQIDENLAELVMMKLAQSIGKEND